MVAPNPWFGPAVSHYIMDDLIPEGWIEEYNDPTEVPPKYDWFNYLGKLGQLGNQMFQYGL